MIATTIMISTKVKPFFILLASFQALDFDSSLVLSLVKRNYDFNYNAYKLSLHLSINLVSLKDQTSQRSHKPKIVLYFNI